MRVLGILATTDEVRANWRKVTAINVDNPDTANYNGMAADVEWLTPGYLEAPTD